MGKILRLSSVGRDLQREINVTLPDRAYLQGKGAASCRVEKSLGRPVLGGIASMSRLPRILLRRDGATWKA